MRPREDLDSRRAAAEEAMSSHSGLLTASELCVQIAGVHYPEDAVRLSLRRVLPEVRSVEPVGDDQHALVAEPERLSDAPLSLRRAHDDSGRALEAAPHLPQLEPAMQSGRIDRHIVERPRVSQIRHPRGASGGRYPGARFGRLVRRDHRINERDVPLYPGRHVDHAVDPPPCPLGAASEPALRARPPARDVARLRPGYPPNVDLLRD